MSVACIAHDPSLALESKKGCGATVEVERPGLMVSWSFSWLCHKPINGAKLTNSHTSRPKRHAMTGARFCQHNQSVHYLKPWNALRFFTKIAWHAINPKLLAHGVVVHPSSPHCLGSHWPYELQPMHGQSTKLVGLRVSWATAGKCRRTPLSRPWMFLERCQNQRAIAPTNQLGLLHQTSPCETMQTGRNTTLVGFWVLASADLHCVLRLPTCKNIAALKILRANRIPVDTSQLLRELVLLFLLWIANLRLQWANAPHPTSQSLRKPVGMEAKQGGSCPQPATQEQLLASRTAVQELSKSVASRMPPTAAKWPGITCTSKHIQTVNEKQAWTRSIGWSRLHGPAAQL